MRKALTEQVLALAQKTKKDEKKMSTERAYDFSSFWREFTAKDTERFSLLGRMLFEESLAFFAEKEERRKESRLLELLDSLANGKFRKQYAFVRKAYASLIEKYVVIKEKVFQKKNCNSILFPENSNVEKNRQEIYNLIMKNKASLKENLFAFCASFREERQKRALNEATMSADLYTVIKRYRKNGYNDDIIKDMFLGALKRKD